MTPETASTQHKGTWQRVVLYTVLIVAALFFLMPLMAMVFTSLKSMPEITGSAGFENNTILTPPRAPTIEPWQKAWSSACIAVACHGLKSYFWNSIIMVVAAVSISVSLGALNGYVLAKWRFRGDSIVFGLLLFGCFIPFQIVLIPMARLLGMLDMAGTLHGLIFVHVCYGVPFTTLFFRNFFVTIPDELVSAARVDGAGFWSIFFLILIPIAWPTFVVSIIWQFTNIWNDFLFGASFAGADARPLMVALNNLVNTSTGTKAYNIDMAGAMIAALPTMLVYIVGGRYFVRGLTAGAVKG
ncbi:MAG: sugar ABC transporter permease [Gammaproteobacteria bacterium]|nr:MAG: sugar ABC transporter permease [Gammaproteobacteria bacterium]